MLLEAGLGGISLLADMDFFMGEGDVFTFNFVLEPTPPPPCSAFSKLFNSLGLSLLILLPDGVLPASGCLPETVVGLLLEISRAETEGNLGGEGGGRLFFSWPAEVLLAWASKRESLSLTSVISYYFNSITAYSK